VGGQTALNLAVALAEQGILDKYGVRTDRRQARRHQEGGRPGLFKDAMLRCGLDLPRSQVVHTVEEARDSANWSTTAP
jgi:carbamoyl-phosphate synthase large subunit